MQALFIDASCSIGKSELQTLNIRGYELAVARSLLEACELIRQTDFDCILLDVQTAAGSLSSRQIRDLANASALALVSNAPIDVLVAQSLAEGSIEFQNLRRLIATIDD